MRVTLNYVINNSTLNKNGISQKWDLRPGASGETQDPIPRTHLLGGTRDPRPWILKVGPQTRDPGSVSLARPGTRDPVPIFWIGTKARDHKGGTQYLSIKVTQDSRSGTLSMSKFICFIRLCLFRMFLITLSYRRSTFNLLSS